MTTAAVLIMDEDRQYEGLRACMGLQLNEIQVKMFVLHHEIAHMDEAYYDNMVSFDEIGGERFSDHAGNVEKYGFKYAGLKEMAEMLKASEHVIPF